jgi:phage portal protein BeeE
VAFYDTGMSLWGESSLSWQSMTYSHQQADMLDERRKAIIESPRYFQIADLVLV